MSIAEIENLMNESRLAVDICLEVILPSSNLAPERLHAAIRWSVFAGGKRFRPALVFAVAKVFDCDPAKLLRTAAAIEMIHTYSLIHDDLPSMDDDDLRRGRETCHVKYDEATAILAGDVLQTLAFQTIAEDESLDYETRVRLIGRLAKAAGTPTGMVAGQQFDIESEGKSISIQELERIHHSKTGAMISFSAIAGAIIAKTGDRQLEAIEKYAENLGLLFQITDDLLDVTQTSEVLGKTAGKDAISEKATYPSFFGLDGTEELAKKVHNEACLALGEIETDTTILEKLAEFILHRNS